jgi:NDP-sugar pyrophosphorylase family protein
MSDKIEAIILAGGRGTRLAPLTDNCPKPLVPVKGRPMIEYVMDHLKSHGITNVALSTAHMGEMIEERYGDGSDWGLKITYLREPQPMGTGGWAHLVDWDNLADRFLVLNADNLFWIDIDAFLERHDSLNAAASIAAIKIPVDKHAAYEVLLHDDEKRRLTNYVDRSQSAPHVQANEYIFVSSGWYIMSPAVRDYLIKKSPYSNEADLWPALDASDEALGFYHAEEPWFDTGTHERLARVERFLDDHDELVDRSSELEA